MQTTIKKLSSNTIELTIKESSAEFEKCRSKVIEELRQHADIKWFRKWSLIPADIIEKHYWNEIIEERAINILINDVYNKTLKKEKIIPTWHAHLKELKSTKPFEVILEIEVLPDVEIDENKMKKIKLKKTWVKVEKDEVEKELELIEKRFTTYKIDEEAKIIESWDKVTIDTLWFECKWWAELPETKVVAFPLVIWSNTFIPGFEDKLIWAKLWEAVEFEITFPADYHSDKFKSKCVFFMTTIVKIEKSVKPTWTEEFIEGLRWIKTDMEWFKKIIEEEILEDKKYHARSEDENKLLDELMNISKIDLWHHLLEHEIERIFKEQEKQIEDNWMDMKHYLEHIKKDETWYKDEIIKPQAIRKLKAELILEKLKTIIKVEIEKDEIQNEIDKILKNYQNPEVLEKLKARFVEWTEHYEDIKNRLNYKKIIDTFFE